MAEAGWKPYLELAHRLRLTDGRRLISRQDRNPGAIGFSWMLEPQTATSECKWASVGISGIAVVGNPDVEFTKVKLTIIEEGNTSMLARIRSAKNFLCVTAAMIPLAVVMTIAAPASDAAQVAIGASTLIAGTPDLSDDFSGVNSLNWLERSFSETIPAHYYLEDGVLVQTNVGRRHRIVDYSAFERDSFVVQFDMIFGLSQNQNTDIVFAGPNAPESYGVDEFGNIRAGNVHTRTEALSVLLTQGGSATNNHLRMLRDPVNGAFSTGTAWTVYTGEVVDGVRVEEQRTLNSTDWYNFAVHVDKVNDRIGFYLDEKLVKANNAHTTGHIDDDGYLVLTDFVGSGLPFDENGWAGYLTDYVGIGGNISGPAHTAGRVIRFDNFQIGIAAVPTSPPPVVPGDYNGNGTVDAADYVVWRKLNGQTGPDLAADGTGPALDGIPDGTVDNNDYVFWRANFGSGSSGSGGAAILIPEPGLPLYLLFSCPPLFRRRR